MKQFQFSFIIPANTVQPYLVETVESLFIQSIGFAENIQIVLVNDGSTDEISAICEQYKKLYPENIICIEILTNYSLCSARNSGLKAATGQYINIITPGNKWDKETCQADLDFFKKNSKVKIACFPIMLFGSIKGKHWLNYKFTKTRVVNIFKDQDCAVFDLCSCFFAQELVKDRFLKRPFFDQSHPASEEIFWIAKALLDEQDFGLVAKPYCRCRFDRSVDTEERAAPLLYSLDTLNYAQEKYGEIPLWAQYAVMLNLSGQIREGDRNTLSPSQKEAYQDLMWGCLEQIDDRIICAARNLWPEERLLALASKYGMTYEQVKELVTADENAQALWWRWTDAEPPVLFSKFSKANWLWVEFMDIAKTHLHVRGSCAVLVGPSERIRLVVTAVWEDGSVREYPCELIRRPDLKRRRLAFPDELWPREGFELFLPLADFVGKVEIRAFVDIDGVRFDQGWVHKNQSPFAQNDEKLSWERTGYTVSQLPDNAGLRVESWGGGVSSCFHSLFQPTT